MRRRFHHLVARDHACPHSIGLIDETSDRKKGVRTPGVQRQHGGAAGKKDNCIVAAHLGYTAGDFHTLLDGELFLPGSWSDDRPRRRGAGTPDAMVYRPKTEIALGLYDRAVGTAGVAQCHSTPATQLSSFSTLPTLPPRGLIPSAGGGAKAA